MGQFDCILPWNHVRVWQTGKAWPCCQWVGETPEDLNIFNGDPMHHPLMVETRQRMLEDKPVKGCSRCYRLERTTGTSMRKEIANLEFGGIDDQIDKMVPIHEQSEPKLRYLELSISNACNNSCRMCGPDLSTHWYADAKKLGLEIPKGIQYNPMNQTDLSELRFLKLLGGEPLLEAKTIKDILNRCDLENLNLMLITNGTIIPDQEIQELFRKVNRLNVTVSIDAYGSLNNFLRTGSEWENVRKTLLWFKQQNYYNLHVHGVVSIYNCNNFMLLHEYCQGLDIHSNHMVIEGPEYMRPRHLPQHVKEELIQYYEIHAYGRKNFVKEIIQELKQPGDWQTFKHMDELINGVRNENFKTYNPELDMLLNQC